MCRLVVPAFNEGLRIQRCLDSVLASPLPTGWHWRLWSVLDEASTDGTSDLAVAWGEVDGHPPLEVVGTASERQGKAVQLGAFHDHLVADGFLDDVVVVLDADSAVAPGSLASLLEPFRRDPHLTVVWGVDRPDDCSVGHWASAFQMELVNALVRRNLAEPRAYGRFFAYRVRAMEAFTWSSAEITDDLQVARFVRSKGLVVTSSLGAQVHTTPAGSYEDFYLQTYRYRAGAALGQGRSVDPNPFGIRRIVGAVGAVALRRPMWALSYLVARVAAASRHRMKPERFSGTWELAPTTKVVARRIRSSKGTAGTN